MGGGACDIVRLCVMLARGGGSREAKKKKKSVPFCWKARAVKDSLCQAWSKAEQSFTCFAKWKDLPFWVLSSWFMQLQFPPKPHAVQSDVP